MTPSFALKSYSSNWVKSNKILCSILSTKYPLSWVKMEAQCILCQDIHSIELQIEHNFTNLFNQANQMPSH